MGAGYGCGLEGDKRRKCGMKGGRDPCQSTLEITVTSVVSGERAHTKVKKEISMREENLRVLQD